MPGILEGKGTRNKQYVTPSIDNGGIKITPTPSPPKPSSFDSIYRLRKALHGKTEKDGGLNLPDLRTRLIKFFPKERAKIMDFNRRELETYFALRDFELQGNIYQGQSDVEFDEMVKMDGKSMQNICQLNTYYRTFCSEDNTEFWKAKYIYFAKDIYTEDIDKYYGYLQEKSWKQRWIWLYKEVKSRSDRYIYPAIEKDNPDSLRALQIYNLDIKSGITMLPLIQKNVIQYLLSDIYTSKQDKEDFLTRVVDSILKDEYLWNLKNIMEIATVLYPYGVYFTSSIEGQRVIRRKIQLLNFYAERMDISEEDWILYAGGGQIKLGDYIHLQQYGLTPQIVVEVNVTKIVENCDIEFFNELVHSNVEINDKIVDNIIKGVTSILLRKRTLIDDCDIMIQLILKYEIISIEDYNTLRSKVNKIHQEIGRINVNNNNNNAEDEEDEEEYNDDVEDDDEEDNNEEDNDEEGDEEEDNNEEDNDEEGDEEDNGNNVAEQSWYDRLVNYLW